MRKIIIWLVALVVCAGGLYLAMGNKNEERKFKTEKVVRGDISSKVTATGTVNAVTTVLVGTQVSGTIKNIHVDFNTFVKKGQLLAQIDPASFEAQVEQAKANLAAAHANVEKVEAALIDARRQLERNTMLFAKNLIAKTDRDTAETNEITAAAQVKAAKAQVEQMAAALKVAETNLKYTSIISPIDGMVISRNVDVGQTVAASFQTPTLFNIAQDLSKMQIDTNVDEADIGKIRVKQPVEFTVDAYPDKTFQGQVSVVRNAPITVQNVVTYDVVVTVQNPEMILKPGMTANVSIITAVKKNVLKVPNAALRYQYADKGSNVKERREFKGPGLWVLVGTAPRHIGVTTGIGDGNFTEIVEGALKEGDDVIVASLEAKEGKGGFLGGRFFH